LKRIIVITTVYRTGEKIYPLIPQLSRQYDVDVLNLYQMSQKSPWNNEIDPRQSFYQMCLENVCNVFHGPRYSKGDNNQCNEYPEYVSRLDKILTRNKYHLALMDNNVTIKGGCMSGIYRWFADQHIPVVACPHGNRDIKGYRVLDRIGRLYDYSFLFGTKEKKRLLSHRKKYKKYKNRLLCGGIPSNDNLSQYDRTNKYILVITNLTEKKYMGDRKMTPFTKKEFHRLGLLKLSDQYQRPIVIKVKNKLHQPSELHRSITSDQVRFVTECKDDNKLITDAACVISAPSTMAFKSIQAGIPTAILKKHGMTGNFSDFTGLVDCDYKSVHQTLKRQEQEGRPEKFIKKTLSGGWEFDSSGLYVSLLKDLLK